MKFEDVLNNQPIRIKTLDGRYLTHCFDELISPQTVRLINGEGMPRAQSHSETRLRLVKDLPKGNLYVRFNILFPQKINNEARLRIIEALEKNERELA